jgi:hypothetical protein
MKLYGKVGYLCSMHSINSNLHKTRVEQPRNQSKRATIDFFLCTL